MGHLIYFGWQRTGLLVGDTDGVGGEGKVRCVYKKHTEFILLERSVCCGGGDCFHFLTERN